MLTQTVWSFTRKQIKRYSEDQKREPAEKRRELNRAKKCINEIYGFMQKINEDKPLEDYLETKTDKTESLPGIIERVKRITELKELTAKLVHKFIDKIIVYAPRYLCCKCVQVMDIYYNGVINRYTIQ